MKKAICIILTLAVLMTCCALGVSARTKIADSLQAEMDKAGENETIRVIIWLYDPIDKDEVFRQAIKECGYIGGLPLNMTMDEVNAYRAVYNRIIFEQEAAAVKGFIEKFGLDETLINETYCLCINADLTKAQIEAAAEYSEVEGIYFDNEGLPVEPIEYNNDDPVTERKKQFKDLCTSLYTGAEITEYRELYYHSDVNGDCDWILVYGCSNFQAPMELTTVIGKRVISVGSCEIPFDTGYGIYDMKNCRFVDANGPSAKNYADFTMVFNETVTAGRLIGDVDNDGDISVIDATIIQRCLAGIRDYPEDDGFYLYGLSPNTDQIIHYYSDFDCNGEREIIDATLIQRYDVGIIETI